MVNADDSVGDGRVASVSPAFHQPAGSHRGVLAWQWPVPRRVLSSGPVRGGLGSLSWMLSIGVPLNYRRTDLDDHADEVASSLHLAGEGVALFTAADVQHVQRSEVHGTSADVTVGISKPTWAADPAGGWSDWMPGTINTVVQVLTPLDVSAAVNAVMTATEAKTQAFFEAGIPGTGTASDAVALVWPDTSDRLVAFAGPRSEIGSDIAQAVHGAVAAGIDNWVERNLQ